MYHSTMLVLAILQFLFLNIINKANGYTFQEMPSSQNAAANNFQPSIAVVIGVLSLMFCLTFLLLLYAKFCRRSPPPVHTTQIQDGLILPVTRSSSGIDKTIIESLPFFRFSLLKGSKDGLECAVCLSRFEDVEILRLLPKCKHAFHINCIDQWLEKHSSCPLCRHKVSAEDHSLLTYSNSFRFLRNQSELREDSNLELYVQREENGMNRSSRFSIGSISFKKSEKGVKEEELPIQENNIFDQTEEQDRVLLHKFNHRIVVSDVVLKHRWSNVSSSDLMFLNTEMINDMTSNRFSSSESRTNLESTSKVLRQNEKRAMSEILVCPRFENQFNTRNCNRENCGRSNNVKEERRKKIWLPIARRTVQWFANRERIRYVAWGSDAAKFPPMAEMFSRFPSPLWGPDPYE
ncbi:E3 ubiquitin-protein ligase ATL42-like [Nicotiana tomentosiformis]|uniref:RING-type E3 ubiquitin transferase n=1 Tax=Nicotiana tabacum TaxID=4097 RepID=A0A1S3YEL4_TOBAC|nr:E3 ubiquitin-protein ligase ATL42-like [Nicotiana tomentosiformis]XP_016450443.1 PREDICTED: E3 ubiquitin-protein ligase ATL42-like [Nicotiana tabacum]